MLFSTPFGLTTVPPEVLLRQLEAHAAAWAGGGDCGPKKRASASASAGSAARAAPAATAKPARPPSSTNEGYACGGFTKGGCGGGGAPTAKVSQEVVRGSGAFIRKQPAPPSGQVAGGTTAAPPSLCCLTDTPSALTFALDLPGRSQADVTVNVVDGTQLEFAARAVEAKAGRRARPALRARVGLPLPADRLDLAATAASMKDGELVVRIPKIAVAPPQTWRVPVRAASEEEEGEEKEGACEAAAGPVAAEAPAPAPAPTAATAEPAAASDGDGSWVEASSSDEEEDAADDDQKPRTPRRKAKKGPPPSGAVLEAVED